MPSKLQNITKAYGKARAMEMSEAYSTSPTRSGTSPNGTWTDNSANGAVAGYISNDGPIGGAGCWEFETTTSTTTQEYFLVTSTPESNEATEIADEDYGFGFWFKIVGSIPDTTSVNAIRLFTATSASTGFTVQIRGQQASTNPSQLSVTAGTTVYSGSAISTDTWHYFAIRRVGSTGNNYFAYLDGTQFANWANTSAATITTYGFNQTAANTAPATWRVSNLHLATSSDISAAAISAIWDQGNNAPTAFETAINSESPNPLIWLKVDGTASTSPTSLINYGTYRGYTTDFARSGNTTNATYSTAGKSNTALTWADTANTTTYDAYISSNMYPLGLDSNNYSIEFWAKVPYLYGGKSNYAFTIYGDSDYTLAFSFPGAGMGSQGKLLVTNRGSTVSNMVSVSDVSDNTWRHFVYTYDNSTNSAKLYINGVLNVSQTAPAIALRSNYFRVGSSRNGGTTDNFQGSIDEIIVWDQVLTATDVSDHYNSANSISNNYTNTSGATASSLIVDPVTIAEKVVNYSDTASTASADIVHPAVSVISNIDINGGGVSTASALIVDPTIDVIRNIDYAHTVATASALMTTATISTQKFVNYLASPATASALLSSNVFYGNTNQDDTYEISIRRITSSSNTQSLSYSYDGTWNNGEITRSNYIAIKPVSGFPAYNKIVKVKPNPATTYTSTISGGGRAEIYVFTADPNNGKTFNTMLSGDFPAKELIYVQNQMDDGSQITLDLTPAFADSRAASYGILIQMHLYPDFTGVIPSNGTYKAEEWNSSSNQPQHEFLYILSSDIINKNINADVITASALATDATIYTEKYINYSAVPSTASADIVHPGIGLSVGVDAMVAIVSGLMPQPAFARTVEYPHAHAEAFGDIPNPTWYAQGTITYAAAPATASALFHMPQANIGENNIVDHMNASAVFVNPGLIIPRSVDAMVATVSGLMVQPTANTQLLGVINAQPMTAGTIFPNPPAYLNLFADKWYASLYAQHSVRHNLPSGYGGAFLKIFEDQNTDITQSTPFTVQSQNTYDNVPTLRDLRNNVTYGMAVNSGPENDFRKVVARAITDYSTAANESRLSVGYFDSYSRKAVRLQNIGFQAKSALGQAKSDFSMEFSIKTTKANQILSYGEWYSPTPSATGPGVKTTFNLVNGKLNYFTYSANAILHPNSTKPTSQYLSLKQLTGNKVINDGQWHHVVLQFREGPEMDGGILGRFQIWIDGELDIQRFEQSVYDPDVIGANIEDATFAPDFYTSAWSIDAPGFVSERDIDLHYFDYIKYDPILAEPMTASISHTNGNVGKGNRPRALMLYWWPTSSGQNQNFITRRFDSPYYSGQGEFDISMSPQELETIDYINNPPQVYFGWDVFPVDVNGYFVSDLVKEEAYGGAENIVLSDLGGAVLAPYEGPRPSFKANRRGYFRNTIDDTRRYIDLVKDIDLSQFDMIFFKNYPDQSNEVDEFAKNQIVDPYFNIRETKIFEDFIKSLRDAVDTGISLMINNPQLALDLKIVDRIEPVSNLQDTGVNYSDPYTPTIVPFSAASLQVGGPGTSAYWYDTFKNNRIRVLNTFTDITDWKCNIHVRSAFFNNDDSLDFGAPSRQFEGYEHRPNGLNVGDEFYISTHYYNRTNNYLATPIQNVKAGTPITAFANQYRQGLNLVNNPYKDYVTSIAIKPGDVLDGRQVKGKIWVNFTDPINKEVETAYMDAIHTYWINLAYQEEAITLSERNAYLASTNLLENKLASGEMTQSVYDRETIWQSNGMYILSQSQKIESADGKDDFTGSTQRKGTTRKTNLSGRTSAATSAFGGQWFSFTYARQFPQLSFEVLSMNTRGLRWLSDRVAAVEQNQAHVAITASATMVQPTILAEKEVVINTQAMLANAVKIPALGYAGNDRNVLSLPLQASATLMMVAKIVSAAPMTAAAVHRDSIIRTTATDQVIVYVLHEDPILYLREDIIK